MYKSAQPSLKMEFLLENKKLKNCRDDTRNTANSANMIFIYAKEARGRECSHNVLPPGHVSGSKRKFRLVRRRRCSVRGVCVMLTFQDVGKTIVSGQ